MGISRTSSTFSPPVMEARRWLDGVTHPDDRPLINVSQAAPVDPPVPQMREAMAHAALNDDNVHLYGPVLGTQSLRTALADNASKHYDTRITADNVAITSGCNQAFAAVLAALCTEGDEVLVPTPWYFNHKMWMDMSGVGAVPIPCENNMHPTVAAAEARITSRTRAIALVTPNNPTGVEYPADLVLAFFKLAQKHRLALIVDETYRDFHSNPAAPHALFQQPDWGQTFIHLYSFSKSYRLTGHRVGAIIASPTRLQEIEKFLDTVTICPNQIAQHAALWGLNNLDAWLGEQRLEILARAAAIREGFDVLAAKGWTLRSAGAYFAYMQHPFAMSSAELAPFLVKDAGILCLPGTMFVPEGDPTGATHLRIAFANLDVAGIATLYERLSAVAL
ncbi:aminotransferase [Ascidiaceihabitans sp.]|uniref:aminotransferase n=1 Tax=Ascidiaceihabitans sp. TaxID=1872644 RepID=UPI0032972F7A